MSTQTTISLSSVRTHVSQEVGNDQINARIDKWVNLGQRVMTNNEIMWFTQTQTSSLASSATGNHVLALPTDHRYHLALIDITNDQMLDYRMYLDERLISPEDVSSSGNAKFWTVWNNEIHLNSAKGSNNYRLYYYKIPTDVSAASDTVDIPKEYEDVLLNFVIARGLMYERRASEARDYYTLFTQGLAAMRRDNRRNKAYIHQSINRMKDRGYAAFRQVDPGNPLYRSG